MIKVESLSYTYPGSTAPALSGLTFQVGQGEIFGFLGPSGAGKSTAQKILIGLLHHYTGRVHVLGREACRHDSSFYEQIGVSFEFPNHFLKLTALENLHYFGRLYSRPTRDPRELLEQVGLAEDGNQRVGQFSKGMKNRLSLARALLHDARLLFLDEPTAGLDPFNSRRVRDLIRSQSEAGKTVFLTTHDMTLADELCHRVAFLEQGRIRTVDRPSELKLRFGKPLIRVEFEENGGSRWVDFPLSGLARNRDFFRLLRDHPVRTLHTLEASLEEVFLQVTGKRLS